MLGRSHDLTAKTNSPIPRTLLQSKEPKPNMPHSPITYECFDFLEELRANNRRDWFVNQKERYNEVVLNPAVELCSRLVKPLGKRAPDLVVVPKRFGGSIMRIYRDTRFGKDKTPFKTNLGISIRHQSSTDLHAPGVYLHIEPRNCFLGCGSWKPDRASLGAIRQRIDSKPALWKRTRKSVGKEFPFTISGETLKRGPRDFPKDHPLIDDLKRTDFILLLPIDEPRLVETDPTDFLVTAIHSAKPWLRFLCESMQIDYR